MLLIVFAYADHNSEYHRRSCFNVMKNHRKENLVSDLELSFDHIHLISQDPGAAAKWYVDVLGASLRAEYELRDAPQINLNLGGINILIRGQRPGENPVSTRGMKEYEGYSSHNEWGTDHFGFSFKGDLRAYCEKIREKGATFLVEPWDFTPGNPICYVSAPDGVSIEIVQGK